jgi:hypothetical protein
MGISSASCHGPRLIANSGVLKVAQVAQLLQCSDLEGECLRRGSHEHFRPYLCCEACRIP